MSVRWPLCTLPKSWLKGLFPFYSIKKLQFYTFLQQNYIIKMCVCVCVSGCGVFFHFFLFFLKWSSDVTKSQVHVCTASATNGIHCDGVKQTSTVQTCHKQYHQDNLLECLYFFFILHLQI